MVSDWTAKLNRNDVIQLCCDGDVPGGPVNSIAEIFAEHVFRDWRGIGENELVALEKAGVV